MIINDLFSIGVVCQCERFQFYIEYLCKKHISLRNKDAKIKLNFILEMISLLRGKLYHFNIY